MSKHTIILLAALVGILAMGGSGTFCEATKSDISQQERKQGEIATGMPIIKNFRERKLLKDILETRDENGFNTYTYVFSEMTATWKFFCNSLGYGLPYATRYTNPERYAGSGGSIPEADVNGLFSPATAEGTWILCRDPNGKHVGPVYVEAHVIVSPFILTSNNDCDTATARVKVAAPPDKK
jgi:hypothetical protein